MIAAASRPLSEEAWSRRPILRDASAFLEGRFGIEGDAPRGPAPLGSAPAPAPARIVAE